MKEEEIEKLGKFLEFQFELCMRIVFNVEYIKRHIEEKRMSMARIIDVEYINYVGRLASDDTILSMYKLLNSNQAYSFSNLIAKIKKLQSVGFAFKNEIYFINFKKTLKELNKLYREEKINDIRNSYVGHLDANRIGIPFDIKKIDLIQEKIFQAVNEINLALFEQQFDKVYDKNKLAERINDNILLKEYIEKEE